MTGADEPSELARLRAESAALRRRVEQLEGVEAVLWHVVLEERAACGGRRRRDPVRLIGEPSAGSA
jgi:hypothetical protein